MPSAEALEVTRAGDPAEFERIAGPFLVAREAENNLALGLTSAMKGGRTYGPSLYFGAVREGGRVVGAALRAGFYLIVTSGTSDVALRLLIEDAVRATPDAPGITGPKDLARGAVALWTARTGQRARIQTHERIYAVSRVIPPRPVAGEMRSARSDDVDLLTGWFLAFVEEAQPHLDRSPQNARRNAEGWVERGGLRVWVDGGTVSMAGASGPTPNGVRVGAVYTPPDQRKRGYASALVAALSQEQLDSGKKFCFLYTDLANPTSNKIYQDIGYEPVCDVDEYVFEPM